MQQSETPALYSGHSRGREKWTIKNMQTSDGFPEGKKLPGRKGCRSTGQMGLEFYTGQPGQAFHDRSKKQKQNKRPGMVVHTYDRNP